MEFDEDYEINNKKQLILEELFKLKENKYCSDCKQNPPLYASSNKGVFICKKCVVSHNILGKNISLIKSGTNPKDWPIEILKIFIQVNNEIANNYWEYNLKCRDFNENGSMEFIKNKYLFKKWAKPNEIDPMTKILIENDIDLEKIYNDNSNFNGFSYNSVYNYYCGSDRYAAYNIWDILSQKKEKEILKDNLETIIRKIKEDRIKKEKKEKEMKSAKRMLKKALKVPRKITERKKRLKKLKVKKTEIEEAMEKKEKERREKERLEMIIRVKQRLERERLERERRERERLERERRERERLERERREREKEEREKKLLNKEINKKYDIIKNDLPVPFFLDGTQLEKLTNSKNETCLICLELFKQSCQVLYLPCLHLFHSTCIMRWLLNNTKCPICKVDYRGIEKEEGKDDDPFESFEFNDFDSSDNSSNGNDIFNNNYYNFNTNINNIFEARNMTTYNFRDNYRGGRGRGRGNFRGNWNNRGMWRGGRGGGNFRGRGIFRGNNRNNFYDINRGDFRGIRRNQRGRGTYFNRNHFERGLDRGRGTQFRARGIGRGRGSFNNTFYPVNSMNFTDSF